MKKQKSLITIAAKMNPLMKLMAEKHVEKFLELMWRKWKNSVTGKIIKQTSISFKENSRIVLFSVLNQQMPVMCYRYYFP